MILIRTRRHYQVRRVIGPRFTGVEGGPDIHGRTKSDWREKRKSDMHRLSLNGFNQIHRAQLKKAFSYRSSFGLTFEGWQQAILRFPSLSCWFRRYRLRDGPVPGPLAWHMQPGRTVSDQSGSLLPIFSIHGRSEWRTTRRPPLVRFLGSWRELQPETGSR
jgi:hypothetical protein